MNKKELLRNRNENICKEFVQRHEKEGIRLNVVLSEIAKKYGLMPSYVWKIVSGKIKKGFKVKDSPDYLKDV